MANYDEFFGMGSYDQYVALLELAKTKKPEGTFEGEIYAAAVLLHDKLPSTCQPASDFIWFKVKAVSLYSLGTQS
jgi:hypothetical protein